MMVMSRDVLYTRLMNYVRSTKMCTLDYHSQLEFIENNFKSEVLIFVSIIQTRGVIKLVRASLRTQIWHMKLFPSAGISSQR